MRVLLIKDQALFEKVVANRDGHIIMPVNDGAGNLIISKESLSDPVFQDIWNDLANATVEIDYIPYPQDIEAQKVKVQEFIDTKVAIAFNPLTGDVKYDTKTINMNTGEIDVESDGIIDKVIDWTTGTIKTIGEFFGIK